MSSQPPPGTPGFPIRVLAEDERVSTRQLDAIQDLIDSLVLETWTADDVLDAITEILDPAGSV